MTDLVVLGMLLGGMFWWGYMMADDRAAKRTTEELPYVFRWKCEECGREGATVRCSSLDVMAVAERIAERMHVCP